MVLFILKCWSLLRVWGGVQYQYWTSPVNTSLLVGTSKPRSETYEKFRVAMWNMGSMTGKNRKLAGIFRKRKMNFACVQKDRKGTK